jgi:apolipoprotein N-acyltransferase
MLAPRSMAALFALAAVSGVSYALAFPPFEWRGMGAVSVALFCTAVALLQPRWAALAGFVWAVTATLCVCTWLPDAMAGFFGVPPLLGWLALAAVALAPVGLPMAALAAWLSWAARRGVFGPLCAGAAFGLAELARTRAWPGLPYAELGASALPDALRQAADMIGVAGLSMLVAACGAALPALLVPALRTRRALLESGVAVAALLACIVHGDRQLGRAFGEGRALSVAAVQGGAVAEAARSVDLTRGLETRHVDLVVWPEHAIGDYLRERTPQADAVRALSREFGGDLLLGSPHWRWAEAAPRYFTSAFLLHGGTVRGRHDKTRLVPLAEAGYTPGEHARVLDGESARVGALVCAEILFPEIARELVRGGAQLLANPSNDAWAPRRATEYLLRIAALRAIETRRYLIRATPTGVSAVIDPHGHVLARSDGDGEAVLEAPVHRSRAVTVAVQLGDAPVWGALVLVAISTASVRLTSRSSRRKYE